MLDADGTEEGVHLSKDRFKKLYRAGFILNLFCFLSLNWTWNL